MNRLAALLTLLALAACGVDGPPTPPTEQSQPGLSVSGQVKVGVAGSL